MKTRTAILGHAILSFALAANAASAAAEADMSVDQIVARNIAARGGLDAWHHIAALSMSGRMDAGKQRADGGRVAMLTSPRARAEMKMELSKAVSGKGGAFATEKVIQLPFQMDLKRPRKSRIEITFQGDTAVQVYDGSQGWKLRPYLGRHEAEPFTETEAGIAAGQQELDGPLIDHAAKGTRVALDGRERVDGRDSYRLKLTFKNGDVRHLWIDAQTFLDAKIEGAPRHFDGKMRSVATYFHDYKSVDGVKMPYLLETRVEGVKDSERIVIDKVVLNPALDDARFGKITM